jgi:D-tyrosyl-tRNA(Tyr) deacylase
MRACIQRVHEAHVTVDGQVVGRIARGLVVLLGVEQGDSVHDARYLADRICEFRIFEDEDGKMNRSVQEIRGAMLVVSQFTLVADCRKGRRPSFTQAAPPDVAEQLYETFVAAAGVRGIEMATGRFRAHMDVSLINDGPVTFIIDSRKRHDS